MREGVKGHIDIKQLAQTLWDAKKQQEQEVKKNTRFDIKNKANADEILRKVQEIRADGERDYYELRRQWSEKISSVLYVMVLFQYFILLGVALGIIFELFTFDQANPLLLVIAGENFIQILGLAYIVVKFLYPVNKE